MVMPLEPTAQENVAIRLERRLSTMNTKTAKLLRKYCKVYGKDYRKYKTAFKRVTPAKQLLVLESLHEALKESPPPSPTEEKKKPTSVKGVKVVRVGDRV